VKICSHADYIDKMLDDAKNVTCPFCKVNLSPSEDVVKSVYVDDIGYSHLIDCEGYECDMCGFKGYQTAFDWFSFVTLGKKAKL